MQRKDGFNHTPIAESVDCSRTTVIVSQETFDRAQEIRQARAARFTKPEKCYTARYPFSSLIVCANCGNTYIEGDRYCRFCGAPMGKPKFIMQEFACIYGPPPVKRVHKCVKCGFTWETCSMVDRQEFCPRCGGDAPYTEAE